VGSFPVLVLEFLFLEFLYFVFFWSASRPEEIYFSYLGLVLVWGQLDHQSAELKAYDNVAHDYFCCRAFSTNLVLIEDHAYRFHRRYLMTSLTSLTLLPSEWLHATGWQMLKTRQSLATTHHRSQWNWNRRACDKFKTNSGGLKSHGQAPFVCFARRSFSLSITNSANFM